MSIFDIFNFKAKFQQVATPENFALLRAVIREEIVKQIKAKIPGQDKMDAVVAKAEEYIHTHMTTDNKIVQWIIDVILIGNIRIITQAVYDDLKEIIKGL